MLVCFPHADMKEAVRLCFSEALAAALGRPHDADAALRISLTASHPDAAAECSWLAPFVDAGGNRQRRGGRGGRHHQRHPAPPDAAAPALTDALAARLASMLAPQFAAACPPAAAQLLPPAAPAAVQLQARRRPLLVGGRYLKLRRGIPQSPWVIDGQRKGEGSVQVRRLRDGSQRGMAAGMNGGGKRLQRRGGPAAAAAALHPPRCIARPPRAKPRGYTAAPPRRRRPLSGRCCQRSGQTASPLCRQVRMRPPCRLPLVHAHCGRKVVALFVPPACWPLPPTRQLPHARCLPAVAAGREDIDVRMLGEGRPFILQIENARRGMPPPERLQGLGAEVLQVGKRPEGRREQARHSCIWLWLLHARGCCAAWNALGSSECCLRLVPGPSGRPVPAAWRCTVSLPLCLPSWRG